MQRFLAILMAGTFLAACGGGEQADTGGAEAAPEATPQAGGMGAMSVPDWMQVNHDAKTVTMEVVAGRTSVNNNWNFNGYANGDHTITIPMGYAVTITFRNNDPAIAHSLGITSQVGSYPPMFDNPQPAFPGAMTSNPTDLQNATKPGASETITFTTATAGEYAMVCYIPAHATAGMWVRFTVSADGSAGVTMH